MRQLIVEVDETIAAQLDRVAPARARQRSDFVRMAIRRALDEALEAQTREAYRRQPDAPEEHLDAGEWEPVPRGRRPRRRP